MVSVTRLLPCTFIISQSFSRSRCNNFTMKLKAQLGPRLLRHHLFC